MAKEQEQTTQEDDDDEEDWEDSLFQSIREKVKKKIIEVCHEFDYQVVTVVPSDDQEAVYGVVEANRLQGAKVVVMSSNFAKNDLLLAVNNTNGAKCEGAGDLLLLFNHKSTDVDFREVLIKEITDYLFENNYSADLQASMKEADTNGWWVYSWYLCYPQ